MEDRPFATYVYQEFLDEGRIMAAHCLGCGAWILPPRPVCPQCYGANLEWAELSGRGRLEAFTIIHVAPSWMHAEGYSRERPYVSAIVHLEEGPAISAQIVGEDPPDTVRLQPGTPLRAKFIRRDGRQEAVLAFELTTDAARQGRGAAVDPV